MASESRCKMNDAVFLLGFVEDAEKNDEMFLQVGARQAIGPVQLHTVKNQWATG